jgi:hypothetical protein
MNILLIIVCGWFLQIIIYMTLSYKNIHKQAWSTDTTNENQYCEAVVLSKYECPNNAMQCSKTILAWPNFISPN